MFNRLSYNPAYAGSSGAISFTLLYNKQWLGLTLQSPVPNVKPGVTPTNYLFSFDMPVSWLHGGIGLLFNSQSLGYHTNNTINIDYADIEPSDAYDALLTSFHESKFLFTFAPA